MKEKKRYFVLVIILLFIILLSITISKNMSEQIKENSGKLKEIKIKKVEHLDQDKNFIEDITRSVKEKDNLWSNKISKGEILRVTFEEPLNNQADITIFARSPDNKTTSIDVFEKESDKKISELINIKEETKRTALLTRISDDLEYIQDTFDLKLNGDLEFDFITDPYPDDPFFIDTSPTVTALENPGQDNIVRLNNGNLIAVYEDGGNNGACSVSTDNGATWSATTNSNSPTNIRYPAVATNGTRIYIVTELSTDIQYTYADDGCPPDGWNWTSISGTTSYDAPSIQYDGTRDKFVMCVTDADNDLVFGHLDASNTSANGWNLTEIKDAISGDFCALSVDNDGEIHICVDRSDSGHSIDYLSSDDLFATTNYDKAVYDPATPQALTSCDISANNGIIATTTYNTINKSLFGQISLDGGATFTEAFVMGDMYLYPTVCVDDAGTAQFVYINATGTDFIAYRNLTTSGFGEEIVVQNFSKSWFQVDILCHNFPSGNQMTNGVLEMLAMTWTGFDLYFDNFTFAYSPDNTAPLLTITSPTNTTYESTSINLNVTASESISTWWYQYNGNGTNVTFSPNITFTATGGNGLKNLTVWANDTSGNENSSIVYFTIEEDLTEPFINITSPTNTTYESTSINLNVTASESISTWWYQYNGNGTNVTFSPNVTFTATGGNGLKNLTVWANDTSGNENSSIVYFTLNSTEEPEEEIVEETSSGGGGGSSTGKVELRINIEESIELQKGKLTKIPLNFENTGDRTIYNILVSVNSSNESLELSLEKTIIESLKSKENETINLVIDSTKESMEDFQIKISAQSKSQSIEIEKILLLSLKEEVNGLDERLSIAKDLFNENEECLELNDLIIKSEKLEKEGKIEEAKLLIQEAISNCRDLITGKKEFPFFSNTRIDDNLKIPIIISSIAVIISIATIVFFSRPRFNLKKSRKK